MFGTEEQKERWLCPLVAGEIRSFFSMTEPEVPGSDPTTLRTRAVRDGDDWVIDGHKWFSSGAEGAAFGIVMAVTRSRRRRRTRARRQIIVPADTPGVDVVRPVAGDGPRGRGWSTHCEVRYTDVRVPVDEHARRAKATGFLIAQKRLGPGRIHHVMRWLAPDAARVRPDVPYSLERETFGEPLAEKQTVQNWIADSLRRDPGVPPDDARRRAQDRRRRRGARRGLGDQVLRGEGAERRDRPRHPGARRARA